jgi:hypothetical protein
VLLYTLEQGSTEEAIIKQAQDAGMPLPKAILNKPELLPGLDLFLDAFMALSSCRYLGMGEGPIPWTAIDRYCTVNEIEGSLREELFHHVRSLDGVYLKHTAKTLKKETKSGSKGKLQADARSNWARQR